MSTQHWNVDATHSGIHFSVRHMVVSKVRGRFGTYEIALNLDEANLAGSSFEVSIDASSIDTGVGDRDKHLRSADFFDTEKFPKLTYKSGKIEKINDGEFRVHGDLTIRDKTRPVDLTVELGGRAKDPWGNERYGFTAKTHIDRKEFGLGWNQVLEAGGVLVGERIDIDIELEAVKTAQKAA